MSSDTNKTTSFQPDSPTIGTGEVIEIAVRENPSRLDVVAAIANALNLSESSFFRAGSPRQPPQPTPPADSSESADSATADPATPPGPGGYLGEVLVLVLKTEGP